MTLRYLLYYYISYIKYWLKTEIKGDMKQLMLSRMLFCLKKKQKMNVIGIQKQQENNRDSKAHFKGQ